MKNKQNILKGWKLLLLIPALFLLFACSTDKRSDALDESADPNQLELEHRECWQSAVLAMIYDTSGKLTMGMYGQLTHGAMALMMIAFAVWLAFRLVKHVSSFTEESPAEVWTEVIKKFFVCFICGLLASSPAGALFVLNRIVFPIYNAFLELGALLLQNTGTESMHWLKDDMWLNNPVNPPKYNLICTLDPTTQNSDANLLGFPSGPKEMMECMVCSVNERLNFGFKIGLQIMEEIGFMATICGIIIIATFLFVKLGFVFYLVDSVFRFAMMTLILPLLIMGYAFKPTRKWTTTGFKTIINSGAFMMFIAVVMLMTISATYQIMDTYRPYFDVSELRRAGLMSMMADFSVPFIMLLLISFVVASALSVAKSVADSLVGGGGETNVQKRIATYAAKVGKKIASTITMGLVAVVKPVAMRSKRVQKLVEKRNKLLAQKNKLKASIFGDDDDDDDDDDE